MNTQYHRLTLSPGDRKTYDSILKGATDHSETIIIEKPEVELRKIIECAIHDNPYFSFRSWTEITDDGNITIIPNYGHSKKEYMRMKRRCGEISKSMIKDIEGNDYEKAKQIHDILCRRMDYNNEGLISHSIIGPLIHSKGVCEGFSYLYKNLMEMLGVECVTTLGKYYGREDHMWNCVHLDRWYHVDITADLKRIGNKNKEDNFLLSNDEIRRDHKIERCLFDCDRKFTKGED